MVDEERGMTQTQAREMAVRLDGVAIWAYPKASGGWRMGGWPNQKGERWIVVNRVGTAPGNEVLAEKYEEEGR